MKFEKTFYTVKSGKQITVRSPLVADAQAILSLKRGYIENTTTLPLTLEEYPNNLKKESHLIEEYQNSTNSIVLIAEFEDELIGNIDLTGSKRSKINHTAMLGMGIQKDWRNQGLGKILITAAVDWAKNKSKIEIVWLAVYASNELGYNLYKNMGFEVSGIIKDFFKENEDYIDKVQMYQRIK
ncbi:GNAT family N-acetyltransferase [Ulvibacter litoralis]|uniref:Protein N-acetyltransferase, RimJ/RimL family n=1 Tax=Ulvibacter litoralis TaxID=227084 RepID=A0A1G7H0P0_9FLAO|nr:GNAT family N-acetyltransferase [Ulvibacter litoralis]GHC59361.1 hypothetical protein GCM10008083_25250 [Ulvibacter litoralis]SDE93915.1 Protein N-acetyltransferase, RimJ/RimL family [Ulvibacter litoralis]